MPYASCADEARIVSREYLDTVYLRLSLASGMPVLTATARPMPLRQRWGKLRTTKPLIGQYGIADKEDEAAWKKLARSFRDIGFIPVRQIGVGDSGRVYEAINERNANLPERVSLKVDRIIGQAKAGDSGGSGGGAGGRAARACSAPGPLVRYGRARRAALHVSRGAADRRRHDRRADPGGWSGAREHGLASEACA
jgi:hypothetical protein